MLAPGNLRRAVRPALTDTVQMTGDTTGDSASDSAMRKGRNMGLFNSAVIGDGKFDRELESPTRMQFEIKCRPQSGWNNRRFSRNRAALEGLELVTRPTRPKRKLVETKERLTERN